MEIGQKDIELIVQQVLKNVVSQAAQAEAPAAPASAGPQVKTYRPGVPVQEFSMKSPYVPASAAAQTVQGDYGVFDTMDQAVEAAYLAQ